MRHLLRQPSNAPGYLLPNFSFHYDSLCYNLEYINSCRYPKSLWILFCEVLYFKDYVTIYLKDFKMFNL